MPDRPLPLLRRLGSAFWLQYNLILLAGAVLFSAAAASWVPAALAGLAEATWLVIGTRLPTAQVWAASRRAGADSRRADAPDLLVPQGLEASYAIRFENLVRLGQEMRATSLDMSGVTAAELQTAMDQVAQVFLQSFLRLAALHQRSSRYLGGLAAADLERESERLGGALAQERDLSVCAVLRQSLTLVQRRLQQRQETLNTLAVVDLQMVAIEQSLFYLESHVLSLRSARELKEELEAFITQLSFFDSLGCESIAVEPVEAPPPRPARVALDSDR
jgi:hypothetical protein